MGTSQRARRRARGIGAIAAALALVGSWRVATRAERPPASAEQVYLRPGAAIDFAVVTAPPPAERLGPIALHDAAAAAGAELGPRPAVLAPVVAPPGWPGAGVAGDARVRRGAMPLGVTGGAASTPIADVTRERVAAVFASARFAVGDELERLGLLELRVRGHDGLVAHVNGREVARRNLEAGPAATALRGPEWESFHVPVAGELLRRGDNLLAIEVRPSAHRDGVELDLALVGRTGGAVVRGPLVQRVGPSTAVVAFDTDLPVRAAVEILGEPAGRLVRSANGALATAHRVRLDGLAPGSRVRYRVVAGGELGPEAWFHTAPAPGEPVRFAVYGDTRGGHGVHARIAEALVREAPDFVLVTGDLVARGSDEADWQRFFDVAGALLARVPYYPVAGNHDLGQSGDERRRMNEIFDLWPGPPDRPRWGHWYSFDVGDVHLVMLDSNAYEHEQQLSWLRADLAAARRRGVRAIFAATHDGPYSRGIHRGNRYAAEHVAPLLAEHGVTMLFSGHDHLYQRGEVDGLRYIVSGGGGAPLYPVRCGVPGRPRCEVDDGMEKVERAHHYVMVVVYPGHAEICAKRPDGSELEACVRVPLG